MSPDRTDQTTGEMLRRWRKVRRLSQMELAAEARVSTRHLSFVETGRSRASEDLLLRLADAMQLPLKHINMLLISAGYAPRYTRLALDDDRMQTVRRAIDYMLMQYNPYPAVVVNRTYDIMLQNEGFQQVLLWLADGKRTFADCANTYRLLFTPNGIQPYVTNWRLIYPMLLKRLHEESIIYQNKALKQLYEECTGYITAEPTESSLLDEPHSNPVITLALRKNEIELEFLTMMSTFGTAIDVTVRELRIETLFPANDTTRQFMHNLQSEQQT
jgi:transcriptional regulator with XRE-family HTH domain